MSATEHLPDIPDHPVLALIRRRQAEASEPNARRDPYRLALAIEGGGMRGVVAAGMATALHNMGLTSVFDSVYGSSAGAFAGTLFVTGTMPIGPTIFYDDLTSSKFISLRRATARRPIMDLGYLLHILETTKPLDWRGVIASQIPLNIVASSVSQRRSKTFGDYRDKDELFTALRASATMPGVAGPPVKFRGDLLFDAAVYEHIPFRAAWEDGCTHVLALLTRPAGSFREETSYVERLVAHSLERRFPGFGADYLSRNQRYSEALAELEAGLADPLAERSVLPIRPASVLVPRLERRRTKLLAAAMAGMDAVFHVFCPRRTFRHYEVPFSLDVDGKPITFDG